MNCVLGHWFSGARFALLCGGGGRETVLDAEPSTARVSQHNNDINGNISGQDSIGEDVKEVLQQVARDNNFHKPKFEVRVATKAGDNYASFVLRAVIREGSSSHSKQALPLIIKTAPASKGRREFFHSGSMFLKEGRMYQDVLPAFNSFLKEYGLSTRDTYPAVARCLATKICEDPGENAEDIIVLEDLAPLGYGMLDRKAGLNSDACQLVLRRLALLHGTSLAFRHLRPNDAAEVEDILREDVFFSSSKPIMADMMTAIRRSLSLVEDRYPQNTIEYKKLENFVDDYMEVMRELVKPTEKLSCVTHGDCWTNNILFKLNEDKQVKEACLIDFQLSRVGSPVLDIAYLIFTCTTKATRDAHLQPLLRDYHAELTNTLTNLGCDADEIAPWSLLQDHLKSHMRFGLGMALVTVPIFLADSSDVPDLDNLIEQDNAASAMSKLVNENGQGQQECKNRISDILQDAVELGYL